MANSKIMKYIKDMYDKKELKFLSSYEKTKIVLSIYRNVVWHTTEKTTDLVCECVSSYGKDLDSALIFLDGFMEENDKKNFENRINTLFESRWIIGVIDKSLFKIKDFPIYGEDYFKILYHYYLSDIKRTDYECMRLLSLEKSLCYQKKKEAISLLGVALF